MSRRINAHKAVAKLAGEMANEIFEEAMSKDNELWRGLKSSNPNASTEQIRKWFVRELAPQMVQPAREQLAAMLGNPNVPAAMKEEIYQAILADAALMGRQIPHNRMH